MRSNNRYTDLAYIHFFYTAFHKDVPKYGIAVYVVVEKSRGHEGSRGSGHGNLLVN